MTVDKSGNDRRVVVIKIHRGKGYLSLLGMGGDLEEVVTIIGVDQLTNGGIADDVDYEVVTLRRATGRDVWMADDSIGIDAPATPGRVVRGIAELLHRPHPQPEEGGPLDSPGQNPPGQGSDAKDAFSGK